MSGETRRKVRFPGGLGEELVGVLHRPARRPRAYALFAHCFAGGKDLRAAVYLARALCEEGYAVLRFDFTGLGESEGDFGATTFGSNLDDIAAAAEYLRQEHAPPRVLVGHSLGGAAVLHAARRVPECVAVATLGSPFDPEHVRHLIDRKAPDLELRGEAEISLGGRPFTIRKRFLEDLARHPEEVAIGELGRALLVMHSPVDEIVGIENAGRIYQVARHPKSFVTLDDADHLLTRRSDARYAGRVLATWASRYLPGARR